MFTIVGSLFVGPKSFELY